MTSEHFVAIFLLAGAAFIFIAALGLVRFPDLFTRMHAASKAGSLGLGCLLIGAAIAHPTPIVIARCVMVLLFVFLTTPIAAHMIGRAAYLLKVPLWSGTRRDELEGRYRGEPPTLESAPAGDADPGAPPR
jgi:multicomponent Na+:H+ antiporter subunit G